MAEVVGSLVARTGDQLTPEDRNWITSVASRQRGRDPRKPTLMLLFDLAFPLFDLANYCRCQSKPPASLLTAVAEVDTTTTFSKVIDIVKAAIKDHGVFEDVSGEKEDCLSPISSTKNEGSYSPGSDNTDPLVFRVLSFIDPSNQFSSDTCTIDNVLHVVDSIDFVLETCSAPRWYSSFSSPQELRARSLRQAAFIFAHHMPLPHAKDPAKTMKCRLIDWLRVTFVGRNWKYWAELASDFTYINLSPSDQDVTARNDLSSYILRYLLCEDALSAFQDDVAGKENLKLTVQPSSSYEIPSELRFIVRRIVDIAINLEQFLCLFLETYGNDSSGIADITWLVARFERLIQDLSNVRDTLIMGSSREKAMVEWSARSLNVSHYYRDAIPRNNEMGQDIDRAIQSAFSKASWPPETRAMRYMVQQPSYVPSSPELEGQEPVAVQPSYQFWVLGLDLRDPICLATAIVPWDPHRAIRLLDQAIGLTPTVLEDVRAGKEGLPLLDYRRIAICRFLMCRGNFSQAVLMMERLQVIFDLKGVNEGGNFSTETVSKLEAEAKQGNICAQTTYGLLLAGGGTYWEVARAWAQCKKSTFQGIEKLYLSARAGDMEACTALSYIWAQCDSENADTFKGIAVDQVYALFKVAVTSQNAKAVLNMGVIWRYGVSCLQANVTIAIDAFLMALQGALFDEARATAANHLSEIISNENGKRYLMFCYN